MLILVHSTLGLYSNINSIGIPYIQNYDNKTIQAGAQTWMIDISSNGLAYFANNDGVLEFDGLHWRNFPLPGNTVVRSVKTAEDGKIYAGGFNQIGYFLPNERGFQTFSSLNNLIPEAQQDFDEVWKIHELPIGIVFQSYHQLMIYKDEKISVITAPESFHFSFIVHGELYVNDQSEGLFRMAGDRLIKVPGTDALKGELIWAMLPKDDHILIATADKGIFEFDGLTMTEWKNPASIILKENQVYCGIALNKNIFAFGSIQNGLIICDGDGKILQHINLEQGLQNNTILSMQTDPFGNLWLGLDNGIDYLEINSPLTYFSHFNGLSAGYAAVLHKGLMYFGTNRGLFYTDWETQQQGGDLDFNIVPGTRGQVWNLSVFDGTLFCGHNSGVFIIDGKTARLISDVQGGWTFLQPADRDDLLICGTYTGFVKFQKINGNWSEGLPIKGFKESSRYLAYAGNNMIWMTHGYKGVFRMHFDENYDSMSNVDFYNTQNGFISDKNINVFDLDDKVIFTSDNGLYSYDAELNSFIPEKVMNSLFPENVRVLKKDLKGNIWYFTMDKAGVLRLQEDGSYVNVDVPFRELEGRFIKWFQFVYPLDENHVIFGIQDGFVHYTPDYPKNYQQAFNVFIRSVELTGIDSVIFNGYTGDNSFAIEIPYKHNRLQFQYSANDYENPQYLEFSTLLEGFDGEWTSWQNRSSREFTNLRHGNYTFKVKTKNIFGALSDEQTLRFEILPPWYLSWWAYLIYFFAFILFVLLMSKYVRFRMEKSKRQEEERQKRLFKDREKQLQTETLKSEKEVIRLRNDKLRAEMKQKDKELANSTMQMIQKSKSLNSIKKDLGKLSREIGDDIISNHINSMVRKIDREIDTKGQWEVFENHFESVHEEFLKRLKLQYPDLTPRELKLCAYLRLNISSKEIATLMNISTRGVEISRYRLRKKLDLAHDTNLTEFIMGF